MKIIVEEDRPGEFEKMDPNELRLRLARGWAMALTKGVKLPRGGEVELVDQLAERMAETYNARLDRLRKDVEELARLHAS